MIRKSKFRIRGRLEMASTESDGNVTIDRGAEPLFSVRPLRGRREYTLSLSKVAEMVVRSIIVSEARGAVDGMLGPQRRRR